jgi:hypothetical protein
MPVFPNKAKGEKRPDMAIGAPVTLASLPPANTERWVARRKAQVVAAVQAGVLTLDEALARYKLSVEEFTSWQRGLFRHGLRGLQITHLQICKLADRRGRGASARRERKTVRWNGRHA